jgi:hypothetical protein
MKYINNKKTVSKYIAHYISWLLNRMIDNYAPIKPLLINLETQELLENYTVNELSKRLFEKSYVIYQALI